jgi:hypothetical protein
MSKNFKGGLNTLLGEGKELNMSKAKKFVDALSKEVEKPTKEVTTQGAKDFLETLKDEIDKPKVGRPKSNFKEITKSSQQGTKEEETRATFIVKEELLDKLKAVAYWERMLVKDILNVALQEYVDKINPKPRPEEARVKDQETNQKLIKKQGYKARLPKY